MEPRRDDRVSNWLINEGFTLQWCFPANGEALPENHDQFAAVVIYGGSQSVNDIDKPYLLDEIEWIANWTKTGKPLLGICLGAQLLARALGSPVRRRADNKHEIGYVRIEPGQVDKNFLESPLYVYHWHNEGFEIPPGAICLAKGEEFENQAYRIGANCYGLQFHPEVNPEIISTWIKEAGYMLNEPGAHCAERQMADIAKYDDAMQTWLDSFMQYWRQSWSISSVT